MELEKQVVSLETAKKLNKLGVKQESLFYWQRYTEKKTNIDEWDIALRGDSVKDVCWSLLTGNRHNGRSWISHYCEHNEAYSAFTVAELGEILDCGLLDAKGQKLWLCDSKQPNGYWMVWYDTSLQEDYNNGIFYYREDGKTESEARGKLLVFLLENKIEVSFLTCEAGYNTLINSKTLKPIATGGVLKRV